MGRLARDLRHGFRMFVKTPALSLIAVVTFGLGIGLTTTIFSIVNGAMFKGLPFPEADRIVALGRADLDRNIQNMGVSVHDFVDWREQQTAFEALGAFSGGTINLVGPDERPERYVGAFVTANMFDILRVPLALGRGFLAGEDLPGAEPVLVLSHDVWQRQFGGSPDVLGRTVRANGVTRTIVGVAPEGFAFPANQQLWVPLEIDALASERGEGPNYLGVARLRDGVSLDRAAADLATIASRLEQAYPESNEGVTARIDPYTDRFIGPQLAAMLYTMLGAVIGVLLIACANVANLLFARAMARSREMAIRSALGASRGQVVRQFMTEVIVLALVGGALGTALGYAGVGWFEATLVNNPPPFWITFGVDARVVLFIVGVTAFAALFSGLVPALRASGQNVSGALRDEGRGSSSFRLGKFTGGLVIAEVAVSCGLLIAAGLMIKSVVRLTTVDLPFRTDGIFTARISLPQIDYPDTVSRVGFYEQLLPRLQALPGAEAVTLSDGLPASGNGTRVIEVEGQTYATDDDYPRAREGIVTPGYFDTFETGLLRGRAFRASDRMENLRVAVVNETFLATFLPDGDPLGRRIRMRLPSGAADTTASWLTVVGVVPDLRMEGIGNNNASPAGFYIPIAQSGVSGFVSMGMRTAGDPMFMTAAVRQAVASLDPDLPIFNVMSMNEVVANNTWFFRVFGTLFMIFGFVALFLASVGLYGVMSFAVNRRTREMGIRMALGAHGMGLVRLVMRRGMVQLAVGLLIGLGLAIAAAGPLQIILFEVSARDPFVFGIVVLALASSGVLASFVPANRVTRVNPLLVLAAE